jgi:hypothetical protein
MIPIVSLTEVGGFRVEYLGGLSWASIKITFRNKVYLCKRVFDFYHLSFDACMYVCMYVDGGPY